jgi:hypothetical protein
MNRFAKTQAEYIDAWSSHMLNGLATLALASKMEADEYYALRKQLGDVIARAADNQKFTEVA